MIGIVLLLLALYLYFKPKYRYISYVLYIGFMIGYGGGYGILTDSVIGVKNKDLAIIYTFVISVHLLSNKLYNFPKANFIPWYKVFLLFLLCSVLFSFVHYGFSFIQILQGGRDFLLIFSLPILIRIKEHELSRIMPSLILITTITSVLYILQIIVGRPLMPYDGEPGFDATVGLVRLYNSPPLLDLFLALTFVTPHYFGKRVKILRVLYFITLICTLGRTSIFSSIMVIVLSMLFLGKASKMLKTIAIVGILFIPFIGIISDRFEKGGTSEDFSSISSGNFINYDRSEDGGTMTYRIAWVYERFDYLLDRPLGEKIFGLGLISESQDIVYKMYRFTVGNIVSDRGVPTQLTTPDIAYGNILSRLGFVGGFIYLCLFVNIALFLYKNRWQNALVVVSAAQMIMLFVVSMFGSALSEPRNLVTYFMAMATIFQQYSKSSFSQEKDKYLFRNL